MKNYIEADAIYGIHHSVMEVGCEEVQDIGVFIRILSDMTGDDMACIKDTPENRRAIRKAGYTFDNRSR